MKMVKFVALFLVASFCLTCNDENGVGPQNQISLKIGGTDENEVESQNQISLTISDTVEIAYQDTITNSVHSYTLSFDSLVTDSRCQTGAVCKWEGDAELILTFSKSNNKAELHLHTNSDFTNDKTAFGYNVELIDVNPHPHIDSTYVIHDYSAKILIVK